MRVRVLRQKAPGEVPYWEAFNYDGPEDSSIAGLLDYLNYHDDIITEDGRRTTRISWYCSCLQGMCGACAMVINDVPALACETFIKNLKGNEITIRPLRKFPVLRDLVVDRSSIQENLKKANVYIQEYKPSDVSESEHNHQYALAKCLKCGLCLEVCPQYVNGKVFYGAAFANDCYLAYARDKENSAQLREEYMKHFAEYCSKSLACMDVCPMKIPTLASMAKLNRGR